MANCDVATSQNNSVVINLHLNLNSYKVQQPAQICMCDVHRTVAHCMSRAGLLHSARPCCILPLFPNTLTDEPKPRTFVTTTIGYYSFVTSCLIFTSHAFEFSALISFSFSALPPPPHATSPISRYKERQCHNARQCYCVSVVFLTLLYRDTECNSGTRQTDRLFININQLDALNFIVSLFQASTCFDHMCSSSGGQKLYYTVSGIITPIGASLVSSHL